jgi:hypothetical protein|tara:strand:+ start:3485 stop:3982 length:498 start_codon:yes stop_codon:yes gene_type:complete
MSEYRNRSSGDIKTDSQLRAENKNTSFPKAWNSSVHDALNVDPVLEAPAPSPSGAYKVVVRNGVEQDSKKNWVYAWKEQEMFTEYKDGDDKTVTVADQKTAYDAANTADLASSERSKRDELLKATDHYGLSDVTMSSDMTAYRKNLRDVPQQTDFPSSITWPTKP